jgi:hypothetical protein
MDVAMVMVVVALTVNDEDERERKKGTVAAQGVVHKGMMMGESTEPQARHDTLQQRGGIGQGMFRSKKNNFKVILQKPDKKLLA